MLMQRDDAQEQDTPSARWRAIDSAMAALTNAIEVCHDARLPAVVDRLLELKRDVLQERERA